MTGFELENLVLSSDNVSIAKTISDYKTAVGTNILKTGDQLAIKDTNGNYTYYSVNAPKIVYNQNIVSNEDYMSNKVLTTLESGYLEGYQKVYAINSQDTFVIDTSKKRICM